MLRHHHVAGHEALKSIDPKALKKARTFSWARYMVLLATFCQAASIIESKLMDTSLEDTTFDVSLHPSGDEGSSYRTENDPRAPFQRTNWTERKGVLDMRCSCVDVVHGLFEHKGKDYATLIILQFQCDPRKLGRRFKSIQITLHFKGMQYEEDSPEVFAISPQARMSLVPTTLQQESRQYAELQGQATAPGSSFGGTWGWEKTKSMEITDCASVIGSIDMRERTWGLPNCASWTLLENATQKSGAPSSMRTAILLKRPDKKPFQCEFKIRAEVDMASRIEKVFGWLKRGPKDDPVLFDPTSEHAHHRHNYDPNNLGALDLDTISNITTQTIVTGTVKETQLGTA